MMEMESARPALLARCIQPKYEQEYQNREVYHYTSPEAVLSIAQGRAVRFTDIRYLNDKTESVYFMQMLTKFLKEKGKQYPHLENGLRIVLGGRSPEDIRNLYDANNVFNRTRKCLKSRQPRCFVFCTCTEPDALNMWNYYINNNLYQGYCIGFNTANFLRTFDEGPGGGPMEGLSVFYGSVAYSEDDQFEMLDEMARRIEESFACGPEEAPATSCDLRHVELLREINAMASFFKHPAFRDENEFRVALVIDADKIPNPRSCARPQGEDAYCWDRGEKLAAGFCTKKGLIVPYIQASLPSDAISSVRTAPMMEYDLAKEGVSELLRVSQIENVEVNRSKIPIRF